MLLILKIQGSVLLQSQGEISPVRMATGANIEDVNIIIVDCWFMPCSKRPIWIAAIAAAGLAAAAATVVATGNWPALKVKPCPL